MNEDMQRTKQMFISKMSVKSKLTTLAYEKRIRYFENWWNKTYPDHSMFESLKGDDLWDLLQMYVGYLAETLSPSTVWNYVTSIRKYLHYMGVKECDRDSFRENIELPEKIEMELYPLKQTEIQLLLDKMTFKDKALFLCQSSCGARIGEMLQIRKKYFVYDYDRLLVKLPHTITKFHRARTIILSKECEFYLKPILAKLNDEDLVFTKNENVRSAVTIKETVLRNALNRCNLTMRYEETNRFKINTHSFRAYFITRASRSDANIAKKLSGEKGYLLQYDRLDDQDLLDAYLKFEMNLCIDDSRKKQFELDKMEKQKSELEKVNLLLHQTIKEKDEMTQKSNDAFFSSNAEKLITQKVKEILEKQKYI